MRVLQLLQKEFNANDIQKRDWYHHWLKIGFDAFEAQLARLPRNIDVCYGDSISIADLCLIPQVYNAKRFNFSLEKYPLIERINQYCTKISAFIDAAPE